ncbi:MAG: hypothetical protein ACI9JM_000493 [Halioglobus sp.]|jgi:hypothetical protein
MKKIALVLFASVLFTPFANANADLIGDATNISLPYSETVDNTAYSTLPADEYCESSEADFFYRYTPLSNETINVVALGADTEVAVFNLAAVGSECLVASQDNDDVENPAWFTSAYPETFDDCDAACSESRNVALTAGTEYIIMVASNGTSSQGVIEVRMGSGTDSASLAPNIAATAVPTSPVWLLGLMASLLSFAGIRKLRKV